jgi:hypothetical protein
MSLADLSKKENHLKGKRLEPTGARLAFAGLTGLGTIGRANGHCGVDCFASGEFHSQGAAGKR